MKTLFIICVIPLMVFAKSFDEKMGDALQYILPLTAYGTTLYLDDKEGQMQFYKSYAMTMSSVYVLKYTVNEKRPQSDATDSFPSGHTASAFGGASFIHFRYGFHYAVIPYYLAAVYTGYSRVKAQKHHTIDVIAAAAISICSSAYFVQKYQKNFDIGMMLRKDVQGVVFTYRW